MLQDVDINKTWVSARVSDIRASSEAEASYLFISTSGAKDRSRRASRRRSAPAGILFDSIKIIDSGEGASLKEVMLKIILYVVTAASILTSPFASAAAEITANCQSALATLSVTRYAALVEEGIRLEETLAKFNAQLMVLQEKYPALEVTYFRVKTNEARPRVVISALLHRR